MSSPKLIAVSLLFVLAALPALTRADSPTPPGANWPSFRGPSASGVAEGHPAAAQWNVPEGTNVRFKTPVPGLAHSSPVIWGDRLYLTTAISGKEEKIDVSKVDVSTNGIELQDREFLAAIRERREPNASVAQVLPCYEVLDRLERQLTQG